jgi:pilus assembly protein Flp/PilA
MVNLIKSLLTDDSGASAAEYALILAIVGTLIAGASITLGGAIKTAMDNASDCIKAGSACDTGTAPAGNSN